MTIATIFFDPFFDPVFSPFRVLVMSNSVRDDYHKGTTDSGR